MAESPSSTWYPWNPNKFIHKTCFEAAAPRSHRSHVPESKGLVKSLFAVWSWPSKKSNVAKSPTVENAQHIPYAYNPTWPWHFCRLLFGFCDANSAHCHCPFLSLGAPKWSPHETERSGYIRVDLPFRLVPLNRIKEIKWRSISTFPYCKKKTQFDFC